VLSINRKVLKEPVINLTDNSNSNVEKFTCGTLDNLF
jgi:hypothetical protein